MKFYSEKLNRVFDTPEALNEAEALECTCESCDDEMVTPKEVKAPTKKQLAADVEAAEQRLKEAYADYEVAKKQVEELSKTYLESVEAILTPAKEAVKKAEQERYDTIRKFNESFGAYQITLTGEKAAKEMLRAMNELNSLNRRVFNNIGWF